MKLRTLLTGLLVTGCPGWYGCAAHRGPIVQQTSSTTPADRCAQNRLTVPFYPDTTDQCGPSTLASVLSFWGKPADPAQLRKDMYLAQLHGTLPMDLLITAQARGLKAEMVRGDLPLLRQEVCAGHPVIVMLNLGFALVPVDHYIVITGLDEERQGVYAHSAGSQNEFFSFKKLLRTWELTDYWTLVVKGPA